jgi:hypothetical protein
MFTAFPDFPGKILECYGSIASEMVFYKNYISCVACVLGKGSVTIGNKYY